MAELEDGEHEHGERRCAEENYLSPRQQPRRQLAGCGARIARVQLCVDQPVQAHRERASADHRHRDPQEIACGRNVVYGKQSADVGERQCEERVLDLHEPRKPPREDGDRARHVCLCDVVSPARSCNACSSAGRITA